jgi:hypothetical protein
MMLSGASRRFKTRLASTPPIPPRVVSAHEFPTDSRTDPLCRAIQRGVQFSLGNLDADPTRRQQAGDNQAVRVAAPALGVGARQMYRHSTDPGAEAPQGKP